MKWLAILTLLGSGLFVGGCGDKKAPLWRGEYSSALPTFDGAGTQEVKSVRGYTREELEEMHRKGLRPPDQETNDQIKISIEK